MVSSDRLIDALRRVAAARRPQGIQVYMWRLRGALADEHRFDRNGDLTPAAIPIVRITGSTPPSALLPGNLQGAVIDRVMKIPPRLVR